MAKILAPVITDNACRDQLLLSLNGIVATTKEFKTRAVAHTAGNAAAENRAEKVTESVLGTVADLVAHLNEREDDHSMVVER